MLSRLLAAIAACCTCAPALPASEPAARVWDFTLTDIDGRPYPLAQHRGQVLLIVNVASKCGFTPQYTALQQLHVRFAPQGFSVIGVPSNDFGVLGGQEPGSEAEIKQFCTLTYGVGFPMMAKQTVKGEGMHPLFRLLTTSGPEPAAVSWNFNKFLIGRDGRVLRHFGSRLKPESGEMAGAIEAALAASPSDAAP